LVIAILAAISIVSYNGIQQRANNSRRTSDVNAIIKLIKAYQSQYDTVPSTALSCVGVSAVGKCYNMSGTPTTVFEPVNTELKKVGTLPDVDTPNVAISGANVKGPVYQYRTGNTVNGIPNVKFIMIIYWLEGQNKNCSAGAPILNGSSGTYTTSTTGNSGNSGAGTLCQAMIPV
jgi:type II secretory pathway pseudopilin PulG